LWMVNTANADDFLDISVPVIQATITGTTKLEICKTLKEFAIVCTQVAHYLSDNMSQAINQSMNDSEAVYKEKFTKWHAHLTILKTNIDQNVVPLLGTRDELIKQCGESLGDVHFQMESCTEGINICVETAVEQEADIKASALEIQKLVKSVYKDSVPMDKTIESINGISK
jgi:predicted transcriptional regulator